MGIEVEDLTKTYGDTPALSNINLAVESGTFLSVVGPSGSGKTTLLRLLDLLERPTRGRIIIEGVNTVGMDESQRLSLRRQIGIVFQHNVMLNTSVYSNVAYPLKIRGIADGLAKKVSYALERVGLDGYENRRAIRLSGGEVQRVALAQALIYEPKILLLDEPTANLDPRNASIIENIVARVNRDDRVTTIMSTHNITQAQQSASKVLILRAGEVAEFGDASRIFNKPSSYLASFMETWNAFSGNSSPTDDGLALIDLGKGVHVEGITKSSGIVQVVLDPEAIIVTTSHVKSSARNILKGRLVAIVDQGDRVQLDFDCGKKITVRVTKRSFKDLGLELESEAYLNFKASAVKVTHPSGEHS